MSFRSTRLAALAALAAAASHSLLAQSEGLEEIIVTADFRESRIEELPISVTVLDREDLRATTQQHFEEAIRSVPNLNLSGEGSRARYFQLRGVGELSSTTARRTRRSVSSSTTSTSRASVASARCSTSIASRCCAARKALATARTRSAGSSTCARRRRPMS
jgi:outer membrane receptor for ferrienterochelin and colicin